MRIVVAPNAFKGSLTADEAVDAIIAGIRRMAGKFEIIKSPPADKGEGIMEALQTHVPGNIGFTEAADPLFRKANPPFFVSVGALSAWR